MQEESKVKKVIKPKFCSISENGLEIFENVDFLLLHFCPCCSQKPMFNHLKAHWLVSEKSCE